MAIKAENLGLITPTHILGHDSLGIGGKTTIKTLYESGAILALPTIVNDTTTSFTFNITHNNQIITLSNNLPITAILPNNLPVGFTASILQKDVAQVTFTASSGSVILNSDASTKTRTRYSMANILVISNSDGSSANYFLGGDLEI